MRPELTVIRHQFVEFVPEQMADQVLYISIPYNTVVHLCFCGCGSKVVTPLSPTDWKMTYDGKSVSLRPSVGNWNLPCRSHYVIDANTVRWGESWSLEQVTAERERDRRAKARYYRRPRADMKPSIAAAGREHVGGVAQPTLRARVARFFGLP